MDELWKSLPVAGPVGIVLIIVVVAFLRHLAASDSANRQEREVLGQRIDKLVSEHLARSNETMQRVADAVNGQSHECDQMRAFVRELSSRAKGD